MQPLVVIFVVLGLIIYWRFKRTFRGIVLVYSLVAYVGAIALKYAIQIPTANVVLSYFGPHSAGTGLYYGLQTVFLEVGLAFLIANYAVSHGKLGAKDAEGYGLGLGFWENAVLLGLLSLINLVAYYLILSNNTSTAQIVYNQLQQTSPDLFLPQSQALSLVLLGIIERTSSIILHFAWGYLCLIAAYSHRKKYFALALPMGFVDFFVPFAQTIGLVPFEILLLFLSVASAAVAWYATKKFREKRINNDNQ